MSRSQLHIETTKGFNPGADTFFGAMYAAG